MGEEVEDLLARLRIELSLSEANGLEAATESALREAADTIESLRASLTRVEEERDEAKRALTDLADAADHLNVWPKCEEYGMGEIHAVESYSEGCARDDKWSIAFDVFYKQGTCFEVDWSDFLELNEALLSAQPHRLSRDTSAEGK